LETGGKSGSLSRRKCRKSKNADHEDAIIDHGWLYFFNALFTPLDVTDYEHSFTGTNEYRHQDRMANFMQAFYTSDQVDNIFQNADNTVKPGLEEAPDPNYFRSVKMQEAAEEMGGDDDDDDDEGEGEEDEYYPPEWEEGDETDEDYEEPEWPYEERKMPHDVGSDYFNRGEKIKDRFNDEEIDSFMKLLDVKPFRNWKDESKFHSRLGLHATEDFGQQADPEYHMVGEVEREHFEKNIFRQHRKGAIVRFVIDEKKPVFAKDSH
jgi:hypothetical protein